MKVVEITDAKGQIVEAEWLKRAEMVHRQLRPTLPADYAARMQVIFAGGAGMAVVVDGDTVLGAAVFRVIENTFHGRELYCDDLITDETRRSTGVGHALIQHMERLARGRGCQWLTLDSGTQRQQAHKFYFREGMTIPSFHFTKPLNP